MDNIIQVRKPYSEWDVGLQEQFNYIRRCVDASFLAAASHELDNDFVLNQEHTFTNVGYSADVYPKYHVTQKRDLFTIHLHLLKSVKSDSQDYIRSFEAFHDMLTAFKLKAEYNRRYNPFANHSKEKTLYVWQARHWLGLYDQNSHKRIILVQGLFHKETK